MIRIEQVRLLEQRVQKVITRITELQTENTTLREQLQHYQERISDLEERIDGFASTQDEIEAGILSALQRLDEVEDAVSETEVERREIDVEPADAVPGEDLSEEPPTAETAEQIDEIAGDVEPDNVDEPVVADASDDIDGLDDTDISEDIGEPEKTGPELDIF